MQFSNAPAPIFSNFSEKFTVLRAVHSLKADSLISFTKAGRVILFRLLLYANASFAMSLRPFPSAKVTELSSSQFLKAPTPRLETSLGITTEVSLLHLANA